MAKCMNKMKPPSRHDQHTLCVYACVLDEEDIMNAIQSAIKKYEKKVQKTFPCTYSINVIKHSGGAPKGYGYLYVSNVKIYHLLLGKNPDGSERVVVVDKTSDMNCDLDVRDYIENPIGDWGAFADATERIELDSLIDIPPVKYTKKHLGHLEVFKRQVKEMGKVLEELDYWHEDKAPIELHPAVVRDIEANAEAHRLFAQGVPPWISEKMIQQRFQKYLKGKIRPNRLAGYPNVEIDRNHKTCTVRFNPDTRDAQFALLMARALCFKNKKNNRRSANTRNSRAKNGWNSDNSADLEEHKLYFSHLKKTKAKGKHKTNVENKNFRHKKKPLNHSSKNSRRR